jgi:hypothetical protein
MIRNSQKLLHFIALECIIQPINNTYKPGLSSPQHAGLYLLPPLQARSCPFNLFIVGIHLWLSLADPF